MVDKNFSDWIILGDEWIISYLSYPNMAFGTVTRFSIAHAMEQYFKACVVSKYNSEIAMKKGHDIYTMFKDLKTDVNFLPSINIPQALYDSFTIETRTFNLLSTSIQKDIILMQHLLLLFKYNMDLKYQRFKKASGQIAMVGVFPDKRYAEIIYQIRTYLSWDATKHIDLLKNAIQDNILIKDSFYSSKIEFLKICTTGKP